MSSMEIWLAIICVVLTITFFMLEGTSSRLYMIVENYRKDESKYYTVQYSRFGYLWFSVKSWSSDYVHTRQYETYEQAFNEVKSEHFKMTAKRQASKMVRSGMTINLLLPESNKNE